MDTELLAALPEKLVSGGVRVLLSLITLLLAARLTALLFRRLERQLTKKGIDKTAARAIAAAGRYGSLGLITLLLLTLLGVDTGALAALAATLGVGAGLAINGALANLAGGVLLLFTRPFKLDDYIGAAGEEGTVEDIRLITTRLRTVDHRIVYLPNGTVSSGTIVNYTENPIRRLDLDFPLPDTADTEAVRALLLAVAARDARTRTARGVGIHEAEALVHHAGIKGGFAKAGVTCDGDVFGVGFGKGKGVVKHAHVCPSPNADLTAGGVGILPVRENDGGKTV